MGLKYTKEKELTKKILAIGCKELINNPDVGRCFNKLKLHGDELHNHSINVSILSVIIGFYVYENINDIKNLFISGLLHDYGKLYIPNKIINKHDSLTKSERKVIETHAALGYQYLSKEKCFNNQILSGVLEHHERMDGTGYSNKKHENEISDFAKIIMIADVYDAMVSDRVYRMQIDKGIVYEYLFSNAGRHFSNALIKCFINNTISLDLNHVIEDSKSHILGYSTLEDIKASL